MAERYLNPPVHLGESQDKGSPIDPTEWDAVLAVRIGTHNDLHKHEDKIKAAGQTVHESDFPIQSRLALTVPETVGVAMLFNIAQSILSQLMDKMIEGVSTEPSDACGDFEDANGVFDEDGFTEHCETEHGIPSEYTRAFLAQGKKAKAAEMN